jgi:hypothetical protein
LVESDPELYQAESDDSDNLPHEGGFNDDLSDEEFERRSHQLDKIYKAARDERSLLSEREHRRDVLSRKDRDPKVNNSFTGPYPLDPTDFNHKCKGANA